MIMYSMGGKYDEKDIIEDVKQSIKKDKSLGTRHTERYLGYIKADIHNAEKALEHLRMMERIYTEQLKAK